MAILRYPAVARQSVDGHPSITIRGWPLVGSHHVGSHPWVVVREWLPFDGRPRMAIRRLPAIGGLPLMAILE